VRTIGSFWPFAPPIWDYIKRSMPPGQGGSLSPEEVYALTAFLLFRNEIIQENDIIDAQSLPKVQMPNRNGFVPAKLEDIERLRCRVGTCP
jgi:cytochrome c